ncbi:amidohydrolase [Pedobacter westerhofensis]|uniref:Amidohydrolase n=1 Tax=Pedobacter westerhofensis TaxID=425512 RepID=A0A521F6V4_9SPHI|nr:M20/M25/M40 family metallo-hydrolase [Pedobacter westerhofensis]SMO91922.1 amidohydrolase [Pedobacter westerhofensis]
MKRLLPIVILFIVLAGFRQKTKESLTHETVRTETDKIYDRLVKIRRDFHASPELAGNEYRTREIIKKHLLGLGLEVETGIYGQSIVGILKGKNKGKKIAWRSDMDALPNNFPDAAAFRSTINGVQQGCGHDVHMAIGLGIAEVLANHRESLNGRVYFIFQPEEETFAGAKGMIDQGLFSRIHPDEIYGLHVTALPVGRIMVKPNEVFAYQKRIRIELKNDVSKAEGKALAGKIYNSLSRSQAGSKPWEIQNISDAQKGLINPNTIFKDYLIMNQNFNIYAKQDKLFLEAYLYETRQANIQNIIPEIKRLISAQKLDEKLLSVSFIQENPTVVNDEKLTAKAIKTLSGIYGNDLMLPDYGQVPYFNDDFAYFQQKVPGVYFFLGGSNAGKGITAMNHAPGFMVDEECIRVGVRSFTSLIIERLKQK